MSNSKHTFVDLGIQHAMNKCHIVICGLYGSTIFFHIISYKAQFLEKVITEHKMRGLIISTTFI